MTTDELKALVRREFAEIWNRGNLDAVDVLYAADFIGHDAGSSQLIRGRAGLKEFFAEQRRALPDMHASVEDLVAEGDRVVVRWNTSGTQRGELLGVAPTGKPVTMTGISILRVADGKIAEEWTSWDALTVLQQLGAAINPG